MEDNIWQEIASNYPLSKEVNQLEVEELTRKEFAQEHLRVLAIAGLQARKREEHRKQRANEGEFLQSLYQSYNWMPTGAAKPNTVEAIRAFIRYLGKQPQLHHLSANGKRAELLAQLRTLPLLNLPLVEEVDESDEEAAAQALLSFCNS